MQEYAKAALNNTTEAVAFYGKHLNNSQFHAARDIANLPVTEWASFASYSTFKRYWFFSLQVLETSNFRPINLNDLKRKLSEHDKWLDVLNKDLQRNQNRRDI